MEQILEAGLAAVGVKLPPGALPQLAAFLTGAGLRHASDAGAAAAATVTTVDEGIAVLNEKAKP